MCHPTQPKIKCLGMLLTFSDIPFPFFSFPLFPSPSCPSLPFLLLKCSYGAWAIAVGYISGDRDGNANALVARFPIKKCVTQITISSLFMTKVEENLSSSKLTHRHANESGRMSLGAKSVVPPMCTTVCSAVFYTFIGTHTQRQLSLSFNNTSCLLVVQTQELTFKTEQQS